MNLLKKIFSKTLSPEDKIGERIKSMIEICMEFVGFNDTEVENVYIFSSIEESQYVSYFYRIKGQMVERHEVNNHLSNQVDIEPNTQFSILRICKEDLEAIINVFETENREMFNRLKVTYNVKTKKMDSSFEYESLLKGTELHHMDIEQKWFDSLN